MMGRALLILGALATLGIVTTGIYGYFGEGGMEVHILIGLVACLLLLFSHCWIMFYLIGTGKAIREAIRDGGLDESLYEQTKDFKNRSYPWLMLAMGLAIATFVLGAGGYTGALGVWIHHLLFYVTIGVQLRTLWIESRVLMENDRLMQQINAALAG